MARLRLFSDIHTEFHRDKGQSFLRSIPHVDCDAVVLAGDVGDFATFPDFVRLVCAHFAPTPVLYVTGNHEHYHGDMAGVRQLLAKLTTELPNLHSLDCSSVTIAGTKIAGATFWFTDDPYNYEYQRMMNDFRLIKDFVPAVFIENDRAKKFFLAEKPDVIVTHHLPCEALVAPQYRGSNLNRFFVGATEDYIPQVAPKVWLFGHTHEPTDRVFQGVRFVANPFGYPAEPKDKYRDTLVVNV